MNPQEAQQRFQQADALFRQGRLQEALGMLVDLDRAFPGSKNILFPMALCYERLGHPTEAIQIADRLLQQFHDPRAEALKARLTPSIATVLPGGIDLSALDIQLDAPRPRIAKPMPVSSGGLSDTALKYLVFGGLVVLMAVAGWVTYSLYAKTAVANPTVPVAAGTILFVRVLMGLGGLAWNILLSYTALRFMSVLPNEDFKSEIGTVAWVCMLASLPGFLGNLIGVSIFGVVGLIIYLILLSRKFGLTCGQMFLCVLIQAGLTMALGIVFFILIMAGVVSVGSVVPKPV